MAKLIYSNRKIPFYNRKFIIKHNIYKYLFMISLCVNVFFIMRGVYVGH